WLNCAGASAAMDTSGASARAAAAQNCLICIGSVSGGYENVTIAIGLHGRYQTRLLHLLEQARGPVVPNAQMPLYRRNGCTAVLQDDFDGLVVQRVGLGVRKARDAAYAVAGFALECALEQALDIVGFALLFQVLDHAVD